MSNFSHWEKRTEFESFIIPAKKAEAFLVTAPEICMSECRIVAEQMIRVYANENHISLKKDDGKDALMLGDFLYENKKKKYKTDFVKFLEKKNLNDVKDILKKINTKAKVYHHSNLYACISDGVEMLKQIFFCIKKLFSEKSISVGDFSEAEIQNFPKHLLRSANSKKFISPELLKFITTGDLIQAEEYINHHQNDLFSEIEGVFPLLLAIQQDDVEIVELFDKYCKDQYILFKYNLSKYDPDPMHPIFYAAKYNSRKCFDYYFETSGKINMTTQNYGRSLLMYACIGNAEEILSKLLIIPEIEIDKKDIFDSTALLYLLQTNPNSSYIKILVERGANLNVESQSRFPLMYATENNLPLFLDNGASLNEKNGVECLYFAMQYAPGSVNQIVEILKKEDTKIPWDSTAFAYACRNGMSIDFIDSFWNRIKTQSICSIEYNIRFAFKLALKKDNNIEILDYLYKLAKDNSINLVEQNIECPNIQTDDCIHSQKNLLWLLQKGFSVLVTKKTIWEKISFILGIKLVFSCFIVFLLARNQYYKAVPL